MTPSHIRSNARFRFAEDLACQNKTAANAGKKGAGQWLLGALGAEQGCDPLKPPRRLVSRFSGNCETLAWTESLKHRAGSLGEPKEAGRVGITTMPALPVPYRSSIEFLPGGVSW